MRPDTSSPSSENARSYFTSSPPNISASNTQHTTPPPTLTHLLGPSFPRLLIEKSSEHRVSASFQLESMIRSMYISSTSINGDKSKDPKANLPQTSNGSQPPLPLTDEMSKQFREIINALDYELLRHPSPAHRKAGLLGLASVAIGMDKTVTNFLSDIVKSVVGSCADSDSRVRFCACEALYNIAKNTQDIILVYIEDIFFGLGKLCADIEQEVRNGAHYSNALLQEIVVESPTFNVELVIPILEEFCRVKNPYIRQFVLSWLTTLQTLPDLNMITHLPLILDGLFEMLTDDIRDIKQATDALLTEYLKRFKESFQTLDPKVIEDIMTILIKLCKSEERLCALTAMVWIHEFILASANIDILQNLYPDIVLAVLDKMADYEEEISKMAYSIHEILIAKVATIKLKFDVHELEKSLLALDEQKSVNVKIASLQWLNTLISHGSENISELKEDLFTSMLECLKSDDTKLVNASISIFGQISLSIEGEIFYPEISQHLVKLFCNDRFMLEKKGKSILTSLCSHLHVEKLFTTLAATIDQQSDLEFAHQFIQVLNWILFLSIETKPVRDALKSDAILFSRLLRYWFHNPIAAISLCLWFGDHHFAYEIVSTLASMDITANFIRQLDQLIYLTELPIFSQLRISMIEPRKYPWLVKTMMGIYMLIPRTDTSKILWDRLSFVTACLELDQSRYIDLKPEFKDRELLILHFHQVVKRHEEYINFRVIDGPLHPTQILHNKPNGVAD